MTQISIDAQRPVELLFDRPLPVAALAPWRDAVVAWVRGDWPDLTVRQTAVLMIVALEPGQHNVRDLAARLGVAKPIVSRVLDRLGILGLVVRRSDRRDRRNVFAVVTRRGVDFLDAFARPLVRAAGASSLAGDSRERVS